MTTKEITAGVLVAATLGVVGATIVLNPTEIPLDTKEKQETYFAEVDSEGVVLRVIVADKEFIDSGVVGDPNNWVETSIDGKDGKDFAAKGNKYDEKMKTFIKEETYPDKKYDERLREWVDKIPDSKIDISSTTSTSTKP